MVPCFRRDGVWIPAYAGMTDKKAFQRAKVLQILKYSKQNRPNFVFGTSESISDSVLRIQKPLAYEQISCLFAHNVNSKGLEEMMPIIYHRFFKSQVFYFLISLRTNRPLLKMNVSHWFKLCPSS